MIDMTGKQVALVLSWIIIGVAIYFLFLDKLVISLVAMIFASLFRDVSSEKDDVHCFIKNKTKLVMYAKYYGAIAASAVFAYTIWSILTNNYDFLKDYNLVGLLLVVILWPFIILGLYHELILFRKYGKSVSHRS